jgi:gliding motility-associated-like protein
LVLSVIFVQKSYSQNGIWTWMNSSSVSNYSGNYGQQGVPAATNRPEAVYGTNEWTDLDGNFWIFGGDGSTSSALWKYEVATGLWTWMNGPLNPTTWLGFASYGTKGVPSPTNYPSACYLGSATWTDQNGDLWLFGGIGWDASGNNDILNDMWKYSIVTNEWTWMHGPGIANSAGNFGTRYVSSPANVPPARYECCARWVDNNGNLWLFSGYMDFYNKLDDMWMFSVATNTWIWMSGQDTGYVFPNYGIKGVASPSNTPGARGGYAKWVDQQGRFWMYGGLSEELYALLGYSVYADMWMYDPTTTEWTWMAGSSVVSFNQIDATFTQQCVPGNGSPGSCYENRCSWTDRCGRFWQFGGTYSEVLQGYDALWMFDPATLEFTWVSGSATVTSSAGNFGIQGIPAASNYPPAIFGNVGFQSANGDFWMFGGWPPSSGYSAALWRYQPVAPDPQMITSGCDSITAQFSVAPVCTNVYRWDFGDPSTLADTSLALSPTWNYTQPGNYTVTLQTDPRCPVDTVTVIRVSASPVSDLIADTTLCTGQTVTLSTSISGSYLWSTGDTSAAITINTAGSYILQLTDTFNCVVNDTVNIAVNPLPVPSLGSDTALCVGQSMLLFPGTFDTYKWNTGDTTPTLTATAEGNYTVQVGLNRCFNSDTIFIRVDEEPTIGVGTDSVRCNLVLDARNPGASYLWNTGETTQTITAIQTGTYSVAITNGACVVMDSITIVGDVGGGLLYIPNAFTPDQNGLNEKFQPVGTNIVDFSMAIYNRWGELMYSTNDITKGWDGTRNGNLVQQDVYVYTISYSSDCLDGKQVKKIGQVIVIR